jgi:hypothetical protein
VSSEAIQTFFLFLDCFAEPVIRPRFARTGWLAMTGNFHHCHLGVLDHPPSPVMTTTDDQRSLTGIPVASRVCFVNKWR